MNTRQRIASIIELEYKRALEKYTQSVAEHAAAIGAASAWNEEVKHDSMRAFDRNPYTSQIEWKERNMNSYRQHLDEVREAYNLAVQTFLEDPK